MDTNGHQWNGELQRGRRELSDRNGIGGEETLRFFFGLTTENTEGTEHNSDFGK
jgi:hypothetical protein